MNKGCEVFGLLGLSFVLVRFLFLFVVVVVVFND